MPRRCLSLDLTGCLPVSGSLALFGVSNLLASLRGLGCLRRVGSLLIHGWPAFCGSLVVLGCLPAIGFASGLWMSPTQRLAPDLRMSSHDWLASAGRMSRRTRLAPDLWMSQRERLAPPLWMSPAFRLRRSLLPADGAFHPVGLLMAQLGDGRPAAVAGCDAVCVVQYAQRVGWTIW